MKPKNIQQLHICLHQHFGVKEIEEEEEGVKGIEGDVLFTSYTEAHIISGYIIPVAVSCGQ